MSLLLASPAPCPVLAPEPLAPQDVIAEVRPQLRCVLRWRHLAGRYPDYQDCAIFRAVRDALGMHRYLLGSVSAWTVMIDGHQVPLPSSIDRIAHDRSLFWPLAWPTREPFALDLPPELAHLAN